jgi:galactose mutarotase-like enzyme
MPWRITETSGGDAAAITVCLEHSDETLMAWPFRFCLTFRYELRDGALTIAQTYENTGDRSMPIHPGLHPYFHVEDWRKREARVVTTATHGFDNRENAPKAITGPIDLASGEVDLQILDHAQPRIRLERPGAPAIELFYGAPETVVVLWTLPARDFICVEPWTRRADAINRGDALTVVPGDAYQSTLRITRLGP